MRATIQSSVITRNRSESMDLRRWHFCSRWPLEVKAIAVARAGAKVRSLPVTHRETLAMIADGEKVTPLAARNAVYALLGAAATRAGVSRDRRVLVEQAMTLAEWVETQTA